MNDNDPPWQLFATIQREPDPQSVDRSLARDEAIDVVLDEIARDPAADKDPIQKRFYSLSRNRLSKQNNRRALIRRHYRGTHRRGGTEFDNALLTVPPRTVFGQLAYKELTDLVSTVVSKDELRLLFEIADGCRYTDIARGRNTTVSGVKSKAFRIRAKIRKSQIAAALQSDLRR
jgi:hypothetical protein